MPWAFVAGASGGIGRATALELARKGWDVVAGYLHHRHSADELASQIAALGRSCRAVQADFGDLEQARRVVEESWSAVGALDGWVHLAGVDLLTGSNAALGFDAKLALAMRIDVIGTATACRAVGEKMAHRGRGSIVTIGWDQAATGMEGDSGQIFAACKAAVAGFSRSLAKSLAPKVRVNCVAPGWIRTLWGENASEIWQQRVMRETPLRRWGQPADVAATIAFLLSEEASFLTGQTINVNGGVVCD